MQGNNKRFSKRCFAALIYYTFNSVDAESLPKKCLSRNVYAQIREKQVGRWISDNLPYFLLRKIFFVSTRKLSATSN